MLVPSPVAFRPRQGQRLSRTQAVLTLVAATYTGGGSPVLDLTFDRPVIIPTFDGSAIEVDDATGGKKYIGGAATLSDPLTVHIVLVENGTTTGSGVHLTAGFDTQIFAANDAGTWSGCTNLPIPMD